MGSKSAPPGGDAGGLAQDLGELEEHVKDYILEQSDDDIVLNSLMVLVMRAARHKADLFSVGMLERPALLQRLSEWIIEGFEELGATRQPPLPQGGE